jgi:hypothetical protein
MRRILLSILICGLILGGLFNIQSSYANGQYQSSSSGGQWVSRYNSPYNNPYSEKLYSSIADNSSISLSNLGDPNGEIASKALIYNNIAYFVTKSVSIYSLDLSSYNYKSMNLSLSNNILSSTPALVGENCNTIAAIDGLSFVNFIRFGPGLSISLLRKYGPLNIYSNPVTPSNSNFFITSNSSPSGYIYVFGCDGTINNIYMLSPYEQPEKGVAVKSNTIYVLTNFGSVKAIGNVNWNAQLGLKFTQEPVIYNDRIFVRGVMYEDGSEMIVALNSTNGSTIWSLRIPATILSPMVIFQDRIYFITEGPYIYSLNASNGAVLKTKKLQSISFTGISPDMIAISSELVFTGIYNGKFSLVYYDVIDDLINYDYLNANLGKPIGISLGNGKIIVTFQKGIEQLPIKAKASLKIYVEPASYNYSVNINGTSYIIQPNNTFILYLFLKRPSSLNLEIKDKIIINDQKYLGFYRWENVSQSNFNKSTVYINQWDSIVVKAYYRYYLLTNLNLDYKIISSQQINVTPKINIVEYNSTKVSLFLPQNTTSNFTIYAQPVVVINKTSSLVFQKWSDGDKNYIRKIYVQAGSTVYFTALYSLSNNYTLTLIVNPSNYASKILQSLSTNLNNVTSMVWIVPPNTNVTFEIKRTIISLNSTARLAFAYWSGDISSNDTKITFSVSHTNFTIVLNFQLQKLFIVKLINITYYNNQIINNGTSTILSKWYSSSNYNYTLKINKIIYLNKYERLLIYNYTINTINSKTNETSNYIISTIILSSGTTLIKVVYVLQKYTQLLIIFNDPEVKYIFINGTKEDIIKNNNTYLVNKTMWTSNSIKFYIEAVEKVKLSDYEYIVFKSFNNTSSSSISVNLNPGDKVTLYAQYQRENVLALSSSILVILILVIGIMVIAILIRWLM